MPGNRPSTTLLLDVLTPNSLGALIALYEHRVFVQATLWGINPFDQYGVESGKKIAQQMVEIIKGNSVIDLNADDSSKKMFSMLGKNSDSG
jgi:glucose-6-phosphate isomerase